MATIHADLERLRCSMDAMSEIHEATLKSMLDGIRESRDEFRQAYDEFKEGLRQDLRDLTEGLRQDLREFRAGINQKSEIVADSQNPDSQIVMIPTGACFLLPLSSVVFAGDGKPDSLIHEVASSGEEEGSEKKSKPEQFTSMARHVFDPMPLEKKLWQNLRTKAFSKTWWFKFKEPLITFSPASDMRAAGHDFFVFSDAPSPSVTRVLYTDKGVSARSNLEIISAESPAFASTGRLLLVFLIGSVATTVGTALAYFLVPMRSLGPDSWKIAVAIMERHIGGAVNYVAIANALELSPSVLAAGLAVNNVICAVYFTTLVALGSKVPADYSPPPTSDAEMSKGSETKNKILVVLIATGIAVSLAICKAGALLTLQEMDDLAKIPVSSLNAEHSFEFEVIDRSPKLQRRSTLIWLSDNIFSLLHIMKKLLKIRLQHNQKKRKSHKTYMFKYKQTKDFLTCVAVSTYGLDYMGRMQNNRELLAVSDVILVWFLSQMSTEKQEACHSLGVKHSDLKFHNFLCSSQDETAFLKSTECGILVVVNKSEKVEAVAPEIIAAVRDEDKKSKTVKSDKELDDIRKILMGMPGLLVLDEAHTPRNQRSCIWKTKLWQCLRKKTFYKSRRFKFKHRVIPGNLQYGFEGKMKQNFSIFVLDRQDDSKGSSVVGCEDVMLNLISSVMQDEFAQVVNHTPFSVDTLGRLKDQDALLIEQFLLSHERFQIKHKWRFKLLPSFFELESSWNTFVLVTSYAQQFCGVYNGSSWYINLFLLYKTLRTRFSQTGRFDAVFLPLYSAHTVKRVKKK